MPDNAAKPLSAENEKLVVLIVPEALGGLADAGLLRATLLGSLAPIRVLLCLAEAADHALAAAVAGLGVEMQILLGPEVEAPATSAFTLRAPPGTTASDLKEFALALSDVVLVAAVSVDGKFIRLAQDLSKPLIVAGAPLPAIAPLVSVTRGLDPDEPDRHGWWPSITGRLEQSIMESLAYNWLGGEAGAAESRKRLRSCLGFKWWPHPYFAPGGWRALAPDPTINDTSKIGVCFDALDRSALYGSYIHRDYAWLEHLGAAFAVIVAVAGHLVYSQLAESVWVRAGHSILELGSLLLVLFLVSRALRTRLQDRWTACRFGAEQLRIARLSLPLLVLPPALATADKPPSSGGGAETDFGFAALAQVKRAVRDQGLPRPVSGFSPAQAAAWVHLIVSGQLAYHQRNYQKLEHAEHRLRSLTKWIFYSAIGAVIANFFVYEEWLLLLTAAAPALAAALFGTGTRLGIVHRAALSREMERQLAEIDSGLIALDWPATDEAAAWLEVRHLTVDAARAMGQENTSWHGLVRRYRDDLPG
jgi:hypothetical protein